MISSPIRVAAVSLLAIALVAPIVGCSRAASTSSPGLNPADRASGVDTSSATTNDSAAVKKPAATGTAAANNAASGSSSQTAANTNGSASPAKPKPSQPAPKPGVKPVVKPGMNVRIIFWNDTQSKPLKGTEIVVAGSSYKPSTTGKSATGSVGTVPYGEVVKFVVYPDGRGGKAITVPVTVLKGMIADSEQDAIHVAISDGSVRVLGNAVDNFDRIQPRF